MFSHLVLIILLALLTFGGVLRYSWFAICIAWCIGIAGLLIFRSRRIDLKLVITVGCSAAMLAVFPTKTAAVLVALPWAWYAAQEGNRRILRFFHVVMVVGILEAFLGILQFFVFPGWILGYQNSLPWPSGTLINRNHFAGLLEMMIPVPFGLAFIQARRYGGIARPYLYLFCSAFIGAALFMAGSRMGVFSFFVTVVMLTVLIRLRSSQRRLAAGMALTVVSFFLLTAVWIGVDSIWQRYEGLLQEEGVLQDGRLMVFRDTLRLIAAHPLGIGVNSYQDVFRKYQTYKPELLFDHAHNDYLETAAEWGFIPAAVFWSFVGSVLFKAMRAFIEFDSPEKQGILLACIGSIFSILVHSLVDFNLQIPSNAILFCSFVGIAFAVSMSTSHYRGGDAPR